MDLIYKCPNCCNYLRRRGCLLSENTSDVQLYSDCKQASPMLSDFSDLTRCKECGSIFLLSKLKIIGIYNWDKQVTVKWEGSDEVEFLEIKDLFLALNDTKEERKEKQGDYKSALEDYEKAIFVDDSNPIFYVFRGGVYEKLQKYDLALENFNKALFIDPNNCHASFNLVSFNEEDIFKYGELSSIVDDELESLSLSKFKEGTLIVYIFLSYHKKNETDTTLWLDPKKIPHFIFRKNRHKPILNKKFVEFEFLLAKIIFYLRVYIFRRKAKFINNAVLN